ncbi:hypothetical protein SAMN02745229_00653 [Butyrivibrio fibrisolvens DSM 3071]|uniref:PAP2 superfamily protein n=2 Tax=Butyrivibrio fibrisolvens TaxID=831 RepID=A0A1M5TXD8_BUTFI|nr:hypothetical protein SAMN02745229_00653 [Butyrivibrio fibrisolvens DSM 3071]
MKMFNRITKKLLGIVPDYAYLPLAFMFFINLVTYYGTRLLTDHFKHYDISVSLDSRLPFWPVFIIPYLFAFLQWTVGFIVISRNSKAYCYKVISGEILSKLIVCLIFVLFPTTVFRNEICGQDFCSRIVALIYAIDAPTNLFPSIHCLESYICMRTALEMKNVSRNYKVTMIVTGLLVFMSTLLVKQHVVLDVLGAVVVAETGRFIAEFIIAHPLRRKKAGREYEY